MRLPALNRSLVMLLIALGAGLLAAWAAQQHIRGRILQIERDAKVPMTQRVVAAFDLPVGTQLATEHIAVRELPSALVPSDSIAPERFASLIGHSLVGPLRAGDPILPVHTAQARASPFSDQLGSGRRAITMPVDVINSVSGLLEPGDLIDLYVSFEHQRRRMTAPLLQGVLVLATGTQTRSGVASPNAHAQAYSTVTLDTSPEDAVKLVAARQSGTITALLRRPDDNRSDQKAVRGDLASLLGVNAGVPAAATRQKNAPVIYGNQTARRLPALRPDIDRPVPRNGVFDLPYSPELTSAWLHAQRQVTAAHEGNGDNRSDLPGHTPESANMALRAAFTTPRPER